MQGWNMFWNNETERDEFINQHGITVFRYENRWVFEYLEVIKNDILEFGEKKFGEKEVI